MATLSIASKGKIFYIKIIILTGLLMDMQAVSRIEKEEIKELSFFEHEVLDNKDAIRTRQSLLQRAQRLGNEFKGKVVIQFVATDGPHEVHTTIWDVTSDYITLKGGVAIPIRSISTVGF